LGKNSYAIGLCCVTITFQQQFFRGSLQVAAIGVLPPVTVEHRHLGKYCSEIVTADSSKPNNFVLCEKKQGRWKAGK